MPRIKLLATDLDGTLLTKARLPHIDAAAAIKRAEAEGITVAIATGRIYQSVQLIAEQLDFHGPIIACNGANVVAADGTELLFVSLDPRVVEKTYAYAVEKGLQLCAYTRFGVYFLSESNWGDVYRSRINLEIHENVSQETLVQVPCLKVLIIDSPGAIAGHRDHMTRELDGIPVTITESEPEYLEFLPVNADKGTGLRHLAESIGVEAHEVAAIGDYLNDVEMLRYAGTSAAVENAVSEVKDLVNVIVSSNDAGGFAEFVDRYVLKPSVSELS